MLTAGSIIILSVKLTCDSVIHVSILILSGFVTACTIIPSHHVHCLDIAFKYPNHEFAALLSINCSGDIEYQHDKWQDDNLKFQITDVKLL